MIIVMPVGTPPAMQEVVRREAQKYCHHLSVSRGQQDVLIGLIGLRVDVDEEHLAALPGVTRVIRIGTKYKHVSLDARDGQRSTVQIGDARFGAGFASLIAGPCAVESYDLVMRTMEPLRAAGIMVGRGDAHKHRSGPYDFQGLGVDALKILERVTSQTGVVFLVEVLDTEHIRPVVEYGMGAIRIGTRNAQNFTLIQAAARSGLPLVLKRGFSMTYEEWLLAAEYAVAANPDVQIILCERGVRSHEPSIRNMLDITAIEMVHRLSHLPIIGDPSHSGGNKDLVPSLALALMAAGADGLMTDVHINPSKAQCDANQALLPAQLLQLLPSIGAIASTVGTKMDLQV